MGDGTGLAGIYTFGQPRVGDWRFRDSYNSCELLGRTFRVVHGDDFVPRVPWLLGWYRHAGREAFFVESRIQNSGGRIGNTEFEEFWTGDGGQGGMDGGQWTGTGGRETEGGGRRRRAGMWNFGGVDFGWGNY